MNPPDLAQYVAWLILLGVVVGLPALLRRAQLRAWRRNQQDACGQCGKALSHDSTAAYMDGFRVCPTCPQWLRLRAGIGIGFLGLLATAACVASLVAIAADARRGVPDPWWAYLIGPGLALGLGGLTYRTVAKTRAANRRARSEEHTSELQSRLHLVCRLLL